MIIYVYPDSWAAIITLGVSCCYGVPVSCLDDSISLCVLEQGVPGREQMSEMSAEMSAARTVY